jgi:hypothetical protein
MMSKPGFFFYTGDWLKDTRVLTAALKGAWMDLLCVLHEHDGQITWTLDDLATFWTVERRVGDAFVRDLSRLKIADVTEESRDKVTIICRKMKRAAIERESNRLRKQKERDRKRIFRDSNHASRDHHGHVHPALLNPSPSPSLNLKETKAKKAAQPDGFAEFWSLYPKKKSKGDAEKAWKTLKPNSEFLAKILNAVRRAKSSHDWLKQSGQFIPHPATWLRARGWEDEGVNFTEEKEVSAVMPGKPINKVTDELSLTPEQRHENIKLVHEMLQGLKRIK